MNLIDTLINATMLGIVVVLSVGMLISIKFCIQLHAFIH